LRVATVKKPRERGSSGALLGGVWLILAKMVWLAWAATTLVLVAAGVPSVYRQLATPDASTLYPVEEAIKAELWQLSATEVEELQAMGFSLEGYAIYRIAAQLGISLLFGLIATVIFWRKSANGLAFLASLTLLTLGTTLSWVILVGAEESQPWLFTPITILTSISFPLLTLFLYFFPDGRCVPSWMRVPAVIGAVTVVGWDIWFGVWGGPLDGLLMLGLLVSSACAQIYRYLRVSNPIQRQQTKWVVFGAAVAISSFTIISYVYPALVPVSSRPHSFIYFFVEPVIVYLFAIFIPLSIAFSILRYRLYDIDLIINRTLVYGLLTGTIALVYWGSVVGLQALFRPLFGQGNDLALVVSTLMIVALFLPLRRRIQRFIDRRFYRRKYDAAKTLTAFSQMARDEVDLNTLTERLVEVVVETTQPSHVSLWLRTDTMPKKAALQGQVKQ